MSPYDPDWSSLDQHKVPQWYCDAKIGLFIHFSPSGYGEKEELPEPDQYSAENWVDLAEDFGAKYIVPTPQHAGGFCNWPSQYTKYSASKFGGKRDILTPLVEEARRRNMKVGLYFNWCEHPPDRGKTPTIQDYKPKQIKELVRLYMPDILWADAGRGPADQLGAKQLMAWFYNCAEELGRDVCVNDRFGIETEYEGVSTRYEWVRKASNEQLKQLKEFPDPFNDYTSITEHVGERPHGDFFTAEHQVMSGVMNHKWETCDTITDHWLWSPDQTYKDVKDLVREMVHVVCMGGNFLLNVGPRPDGSIPQRDRDILRGIGSWLNVNGEAIYGSCPLSPAEDNVGLVPRVLWTEFDPTDNYQKLQELINKNGPIYFTRKGNTAYAIHLGWPGDQVRIVDMEPRSSAKIRMLGLDEELEWGREGGDLVIQTPDERPCDHAYSFRIPLPIKERSCHAGKQTSQNQGR